MQQRQLRQANLEPSDAGSPVYPLSAAPTVGSQIKTHLASMEGPPRLESPPNPRTLAVSSSILTDSSSNLSCRTSSRNSLRLDDPFFWRIFSRASRKFPLLSSRSRSWQK